ncbi:class I SAM-dependent methyltransferase [Lactococcus nasutitermitis]|uniref:Class I SAM-dependent methyltransferase n=1 Tax=Lactococcus nasutitermitis TaxID=1652957 RepID=A0ABV9JAW7_9LACT|nr:class I SAM-dependent methyltransferase [Lactococcus nasutitermitis]
MNMEKVEQAFGLLTANIEVIQRELNTDFYDAFVEQNANFLGAMTVENLTVLSKNNDQLRALNLTKIEWQKLFQFVLLKGSQVAPLQPNHALTPDSIGLLFEFIIEQLFPKNELRLIEFGSGTGNLAETLLVNTVKNIDYLGFEVDDLLLDLSASMSEIIGTKATFIQQDAVQARVLEPADVLISDLPIGFYPDDALAAHFEVANPDGHTYAHHLLIEQGFKYLKDNGVALFLAPEELLNSAQAPFLKKWLPQHARLSAVITLPESLFKAENKAIFVLEKSSAEHPTFVYPLTSLTDRESLQNFMTEFKKSF